MSNLFAVLENTADGAFIINENLKIVYWNRAAEEILGFTQSEVVGQLCYQILQGYDEHHQLICRFHCQVAQAAFGGELISDYDLQIRTKSGNKRWMNLSILTVSDNIKEGQNYIIHLFRDINQKKVAERFMHRVLKVARRYHNLPKESDTEAGASVLVEVLTSREREVLMLLAKGNSTKEIARILSLSPSTVRNHIQHVLQKLQVHSRVEAVTIAIKYDLGG